MKRFLPIILLLGVLSVISGFLMSKASLVGRVGISVFYREYSFLKIWWQGALVVFAILTFVLFIQGLFERYFSSTTALLTHLGFIVAALAGLYFTYYDFRHTLSHRWLGERFHLGAYIFWIGWILTCLFLIFSKKRASPAQVYPDKKIL